MSFSLDLDRKWLYTPVVSSVLLAAILFPGPAAHAQSLALDFTDGLSDSVNNPNQDDSVGWTFTLNNSVMVTGLGLWDEGADGLRTDHKVGLWDSGGILLASTTITSGSNAVASTSTDGDWLFNDISPLVLASGTYTIGALYTSDSYDAIRFGTSAATDSSLTYVSGGQSYVGAGTGLTDPTQTTPYWSDSVFGPNLRIEAAPTTDAPEPGSLALLFSILGVGGMFPRRRKK